MSESFLSQELVGKTIVSVTNGQIVAKVVDVLIDPEARRVTALVTSKGGLFRRKGIEAIPGEEVQVWGQDVILVSRPDVVVQADQLPGLERCLRASDQISGHTVINTEGARLGELGDVVVDMQGQVVAYHMARVSVGGSVAKSKRIAVELTRSLGPDVLIVEAAPEVPAEPEPPVEPEIQIEPEAPVEPEIQAEPESPVE